MTIDTVLRVNRRMVTVLAAAMLTAGCSTFTDSNAVARVEDIELSDDGLSDLLDEQDISGEQRTDLALLRGIISGWIESTAVENELFNTELVEQIPDEQLATLYRQGIETAGVTCALLLVAPSADEAEDAAVQLTDGAEFEAVFAEYNTDPDLAAVNGDAGCFDINQVQGPGEPPPEVEALFSVNAGNPVATAPTMGPDGAERGLLIQFREIDEFDENQRTQVLDLIRQNAGVGIVLDDIDIYVNSRYGTFDRATGSVVALT